MRHGEGNATGQAPSRERLVDESQCIPADQHSVDVRAVRTGVPFDPELPKSREAGERTKIAVSRVRGMEV